jgi:hypothetical protein
MVGLLEAGKSRLVTLGIDFNDTTQGAKMEILWATEVEPKKQTVTIKAPIGELIRPVTMSESLFIAEQGGSPSLSFHLFLPHKANFPRALNLLSVASHLSSERRLGVKTKSQFSSILFIIWP